MALKDIDMIKECKQHAVRENWLRYLFFYDLPDTLAASEYIIQCAKIRRSIEEYEIKEEMAINFVDLHKHCCDCGNTEHDVKFFDELGPLLASFLAKKISLKDLNREFKRLAIGVPA